MILEHALLPVREGEEEQFIAALTEALSIIESAPGCHGAEVRRQVENSSIFLLLVRWESLEAHQEFRESALYSQWRELTHPSYVEAITVTHFNEPLGH